MDNIIFYILAGAIGILFAYGMYSYFTLPPNINRTPQVKKRLEDYEKTSHICPVCGYELTTPTVFCPKCNTITPRVRDMLNSYPDKHPTEYIAHYSDDGYTCPLCHQNEIYIEKVYLKIPIICCTKCHGYFLNPNITEPYITDRPSLFSTIKNSLFTIILLGFWTWCIFEPPIDLLIILMCAAVPVLILWNQFSSKKSISASELRFKQNPDYLQLLADMGYLHRMAPKFRTKLKKYGPNGEVRCEYCNRLMVTTDSHCSHCTAPLPTQRYQQRITEQTHQKLRDKITSSFFKKLVAVIFLAFITALIIWFLL